MTTTFLTAGAEPRDRIDQAGLLALVGIVAAMQLSIAATQILLGVASMCWFASHLTRSERLEAPPFFWPLVVYAALTLASAGFSLDPRVSFSDCKQLVLLMLIPLVYDFARGGRSTMMLSVILTVGAAERARRHRAVRRAQLRQPGPPAAGHVVALDDLLGHADAGDLRRRGAAAACQAWPSLGRLHHAGAGREPDAHADPRRLDRRRRRRRLWCSSPRISGSRP